MHGKLSVFVESRTEDHLWDFWILEIHTDSYRLYIIPSRILSILEKKDKDGNDSARF